MFLLTICLVENFYVAVIMAATQTASELLTALEPGSNTIFTQVNLGSSL
jgi:hypothetical protein